MGPLTKLWRRAIRRQEMPDKKRIDEALQNSDWKDVVLDDKDQSVYFIREGMRLDMGGIAKGYAIDQAYKVLFNEGYPISLIDGGGDIYAGHAPPEKEGWTLTIESNTHQENVDIILKNAAVASSGSSFRYIEFDNERYSHMINPMTGYGINNPHTVLQLQML